ncbi:MAG: PKD domain-containing protein [Thermoplasmata archaeon]|nr:PKD domain-containing protein [Thermoplasmata archaeon]
MEKKHKILITALVAVIIAASVGAAYEMDVFEDDDDDDENGGPGPTYDNPVAVINASKTHADVDEEIEFNGSASYDEDDNITFYHWDFGDGITNDSMTVNHNFTASGAYNVTLTVTDAANHTNTTNIYIGITQREHEEGRLTSGTNDFDFIMGEMASYISVNSTVWNSFTDPTTTEVTLRLYFNETEIWNATVQSSSSAHTVGYGNHTNLSAGNWRWEIEINSSDPLPDDVNWEVDVVIIYV